MKEYIILQTVSPDYRFKLYDILSKKFGASFSIFAGKESFEDNITSNLKTTNLTLVKNFFFFNKRFLFQTGMWNRAVICKVIVLEMNPRVISNWIILILRMILRKKTVLWGHVWSIGGSKERTNILRSWMRKLGSMVIVYTKSQKIELRRAENRIKVYYAPNALYYKSEMLCSSVEDDIRNIIYVGRLTKEKKPLILVKAYMKILPYIDVDSKLIIIGEGNERKRIEKFIILNGLENRVVLTGHISNYLILKEYYDKALCSVSSGYIGLSVTQSLGFGVPMIVSKNENHSPEIEAVKEGFNAVFFETDNVNSLGEKIINFFENKSQWVKKRSEINIDCKSKYSIESMSKTFINIFENVK
ncbi:hypothetical protein UJ101_00542 [Flavobacteriaceae bacterium UJ101]|nr:hypothetical protein UJ101_00542 [Flavobacteriaceae bacterium UJ101]